MTTKDKLNKIAGNLWWSWNPDALQLFDRLNPDAFRVSSHNPRVALSRADTEILRDSSFESDVNAVYERFLSYMAANPATDTSERTAYFCMEFGLHESLPLYSGGLGILAGDHLKAASDAGLNLTGIGLFLRDGYFKQYFDDHLLQQAEHPSIDVTEHPLEPVLNSEGDPLLVSVDCGNEEVFLRTWRLRVGRVELYLLDSDVSTNRHENRFLTSRLYQGRTHIRLKQEIVLGIGGVRLLAALGKDVDVFHMNEGHCAFLALELLKDSMFGPDLENVRSRVVFTTHTPVLAGHDRFEPKLILSELESMRAALRLSKRQFLSLGRVNAESDDEWFTMTILALKSSRAANGVSELNGHVARAQWHPLFAPEPVNNVPIGYVTNGVHLETWTSPDARAFLKRHVGDWSGPDASQNMWSKVDDIPAKDLWNYRERLRSALVAFVNEHSPRQSFDQKVNLSPSSLTIGFARRFASYKRALLLFSDLDRAKRLFSNPDLPIQIIFAGKAHPDNDEGRYFIRRILELSRLPEFEGKVVFLENYHMGIGKMMVSGTDVWLNNPRRPHEACGTSGQKVNIHGGLNLSVLDGWWAEGFDGANGWAIGSGAEGAYHDDHHQDTADAESLYAVLENEIVPMFYNRDSSDIPVEWVSRMRQAMRGLTYEYSARRMMRDYIRDLYSVSAPASV